MHPEKKIIVVYPDIYEDLAVAIQHGITKVDGFDCASWSVEHYKQNASQLSGRSYVIFVGSARENRFTKMYQPQIPRIVNVNGSCLGWDGSKAIIFGDGDLKKKAAFDYFKARLGYDSDVSWAASAGITGSTMSAGFLEAIPISMGGIFGSGITRIFKTFNISKSRKELRYEQTKMAIDIFLLTELEYWTKGN